MNNYNFKKDDFGQYIIEKKYNSNFTQKSESILAQCNGELGLRNSLDFKTLEESRGLFVAGLYSKSDKNDISQLVNCPDLTTFEFYLNNTYFKIDKHLKSFERSLNVFTGESIIQYNCELETGEKFKVLSKRFVSYKNLNLIVQNLEIEFLDDIENFKVSSGIYGNITNSGVSHLKNVQLRVYDKEYMESISQTDGKTLSILTTLEVESDKVDFTVNKRSISAIHQLAVKSGQKVTLRKLSLISKDLIVSEENIKQLREVKNKSYENLLKEHISSYKKYFDFAKIEIEGARLEEEVKINHAIYHMIGMASKTSDNVSIGAKSLTGEGYNGHVFWDTEIFILPFYTTLFPEISRKLLQFRYNGIEGAKEKAKAYGYKGTMYPWEVTDTGFEETPLYSALNIHTGKRTKIYSGIKEHHITADIAYGIYQYLEYTKDYDFMEKYGYEILFNCANFWASRCSFDKEKNVYVINDVIGPDEYTEHVNNNAFTNYMANFTLKFAIESLEKLNLENIKLYNELFEKCEIYNNLDKWTDVISKIYLPVPNENNIIPQDDTFLFKPEISDINKYKNNPKKQTILLDYSREEVIMSKVLKQADTIMLFSMFPKLFSEEIMIKNILYYESFTIHDSSLSYCSHARSCANIGEIDIGFKFFEKSLDVDINEHFVDSVDGVHAAGLAGIWNAIIFGFAGMSYDKGVLDFKPNLPKHWKSISFKANLDGEYFDFKICNNCIILEEKLHCKVTTFENVKIVRK